jgi:hypothetical protein
MMCLFALAGATRAAAQEPENTPLAPSQSSSSDTTKTPSPVGEEPTDQPPVSIDGDSPRVQYVGPDTYILRDAQGRAQQMPGMTYEDFLAAWKRLQQVDEAERGPHFVIDRVVFTGRAHDRHAELQCDITVRLLTEEPVDVPLGMTEAILQGEAQFTTFTPNDNSDGDKTKAIARGDDYLDYDPQRGGFVARFAAGSSQPRSVSLTLLVPLSRDAAGHTLSLTCPRSTSSTLALSVGDAVTEADVSAGVLTAQEMTPDGTRLIVAGAMGPLRLSWQTPQARAGAFATVLNAEGATRIAIDGRSVRTNARLTVQSYGGSFDRLRVLLPRGAQLVQSPSTPRADDNPEYQISLEPMTSDAGAANDGHPRQAVLVEFPEQQRGPVTIDLATEQPIGLEPDSTVELGGMEVVGAVRQFGDVTLEVAPDWQVLWDLGPHVRQVDPSEVDSLLQQPDVTAAFQYDREPWSLAVRVAARRFRVLATPEFVLNCSPDEARLTIRLVYQVLGARAFGFRVNLNGWELTADPVDSGGLVDDHRIFVSPSGVLELPLARALSRRADISFTVQRALARGDQPIRLPLPAPIADSVSPGELIVRTAAGMDLLPDFARSTGLTTRPNSEAPVTAANDGVGAYSFHTSGAEAVFVAERILRSREVAHDIFTSVAFEKNDVQVEQQVDYDVRHEPIQELSFKVPGAVRTEMARPEVLLVQNDARHASEDSPPELPLGLIPYSDDQQPISADSVGTFHVALPQSRLGKFSVLVRYRIDRPVQELPNGDWQLPLVRPLDGRLGTHRLACRREPQFSVSLGSTSEPSAWKQVSAADSSSNSSFELETNQPEEQIPLSMQALDSDSPAETFVERVWLQTWVSGDLRQERAAFRFRTAGSQIAVELAPQTPDALEVLMDGDRAQVLSREPGRVVVAVSQPGLETDALPAHGSMDSHTIELRYHIPIRTAPVTRHVMTPHQVVGSTALAESYWQIVLPADTHLIRSPAQMTAAGAWQWLGSFWGRRPTRTQEELEAWSGATTRSGTLPPQSEYLFTGLAPMSTMQFVTAPRWLIVLVASAMPLGLVLGYLHVPALRRPWGLTALALVLAGLALSFPAAALLLAQASALGLLLVVLATVIARLVVRPAPWGVVIPVSGSRREIAPRVETIVVPPIAVTASTAPTVSLREPEAE